MTNKQLVRLKKKYIVEGYKKAIKESNVIDVNELSKKILERIKFIEKQDASHVENALADMNEEKLNQLLDGLNALILTAHGY